MSIYKSQPTTSSAKKVRMGQKPETTRTSKSGKKLKEKLTTNLKKNFLTNIFRF